MKDFEEEKKSRKTNYINFSKNEIFNKALAFHSQDNIPEAREHYEYLINQGFKNEIIFSNYGAILENLGKIQEAEFSYRKAIEINPDFAYAHYNLGNILRDLKNLENAELSYREAIKIDPNLAIAHYNLGNLLRDIENLDEAELFYRKAIKINPDYADAHSNLGNILRDRGKLKDAELSYLKAIEINPEYSLAYYFLSLLKINNQTSIWREKLFSKSMLCNKSRKDQINIFFARANILHSEKKYKESSECLKLANNLKLNIEKSNAEVIFNKSKLLLIESNKKDFNQKKYKNAPQSIFIVGMVRSGSTLLESILSMNKDVDDLGEIKILEESFLYTKKNPQSLSLAEVYWKKIKDLKKKSNITTNKNLFNYQYSGIIAKKIPNSKIIHCFRNPLDNILSIYRANFADGNEYSYSLINSAKVYLHQEELMTKYKSNFRSKIYDLNYDLLVSNPHQEIKSLIEWLGWKWNDKYLSPHLNLRSVFTASSIQVRFPINSKSIEGWKNYREMLRPAMEEITKLTKYQNLKY